MSNGNKLVVAGLFTALIAAGTAMVMALSDRYGWYTTSMIVLAVVWVIGMLGLAIGDALNFCAERGSRKRNEKR